MRTSLRFAVLAAALPACGSSGGATGGAPPSSFDAGGGLDSSLPPVTCPGVETNCNGTCVDLTLDPANCGACGIACAACCAGACVSNTATCAFSVTGVQPAVGGVNGGDYITLKGQGFTAGMQVLIDGAPAPSRVIDAATALVQTPPDVAGRKDITIQHGTSTATLPNAFLYAVGSIQLPWQEIKMASVRGEDPGLGVLQDNRVLIAGGTTTPDSTADALASGEMFDRATNTVGAAKGAMSMPRWHVATIPLMTGKVLVAGGACGADDTGCNAASDATKAEIFDPQTNTFTPTSNPLSVARNYPRAVMLADGRVIIASATQATVDLYDPVADSFTQVPTLAIHTFGFMVRLRDGRAMLGGGDGGQTAVELFDPQSNTFTATGALNVGRSMLTAHTLPDGRVIAIGGASTSAGAVTVPEDSVELYDPAAKAWSIAPYKLSTPRCWHASALVRDGTVVVMGGYNVDKSCSMTSASQNVDQIDPTSNSVSTFGTLPDPNTEWTAVTLLDGSVIGVGGGACGTSSALPDVYFLQGVPIVAK